MMHGNSNKILGFYRSITSLIITSQRNQWNKVVFRWHWIKINT